MRRPLRARVWFYKPEWSWRGWHTLIPAYTGSDEYDWHTIVLGWTITGRVIIATHHCPGTGKCAEVDGLTDWPHSAYGDDEST